LQILFIFLILLLPEAFFFFRKQHQPKLPQKDLK